MFTGIIWLISEHNIFCLNNKNQGLSKLLILFLGWNSLDLLIAVKEYAINMQKFEQLKQFVDEMAAEHKTAVSNKNTGSLRKIKIGARVRAPKLEEDNKVLAKAYKSTNEEVKAKGNIIPAAEWLLDNYYILEEQFKEIQYTVKNEFYMELPVLTEGKFSGYPRVYGAAAGMAEYFDGLIDEETLISFLETYQQQIHLTSKELWVFPVMLRICLLERIKDIAIYISDTIQLRKQAEQWAVKLLQS
ncbi:MAG TPA: hypothetical protein DIW17_05495, partial [Clostridiales bacterium]|nr:hypothetical protein [Clostridiales bacterium]